MTKRCNILILSARRRKRLYDLCNKEMSEMDISGTVYVSDCNPKMSSVCMSTSNYIKSCRASQENYITELTGIVSEHAINIIIPTNDLELQKLSLFRKAHSSSKLLPIISSHSIVNTFSSKKDTHDFFLKNGFKTPRIISNPTKNDLPLFAKLNHSSSAIGAQKVESEEQLSYLLSIKKDYVFQEFIDGDEFTIDFFIDINGKLICVVPRQRIEVRSGEVSKALAVKDSDIIHCVETLSPYLKGAYGPLCVQVIKNETGIFFIEINTRFGGGYPLTHAVGGNFLRFIFNDYFNICNEMVVNWKTNTMMLRYDSEVIVHDYCI